MKLINKLPALEGNGGNWGFIGLIDGKDILLRDLTGVGPVDMTFFGGTREQDPSDNGETECGPRTRNTDGTENHIPGCSLPTSNSPGSGTAGSPIAGLPCGVEVHIWKNPMDNPVITHKIDDGPEEGTGHAIDATRKTFEDCGGNFDDGLLKVFVRIVNAVQHLPQSVQDEAKALMNG